jgi:hypothetical protein
MQLTPGLTVVEGQLLFFFKFRLVAMYLCAVGDWAVLATPDAYNGGTVSLYVISSVTQGTELFHRNVRGRRGERSGSQLALPHLLLCTNRRVSFCWCGTLPLLITTNPVAPEPEGSSAYSQEPATGPYPEPAGSNLHSPSQSP